MQCACQKSVIRLSNCKVHSHLNLMKVTSSMLDEILVSPNLLGSRANISSKSPAYRYVKPCLHQVVSKQMHPASQVRPDTTNTWPAIRLLCKTSHPASPLCLKPLQLRLDTLCHGTTVVMPTMVMHEAHTKCVQTGPMRIGDAYEMANLMTYEALRLLKSGYRFRKR